MRGDYMILNCPVCGAQLEDGYQIVHKTTGSDVCLAKFEKIGFIDHTKVVGKLKCRACRRCGHVEMYTDFNGNILNSNIFDHK